MKEKLLASAALVLLACTPAMAQGLDDVKHKFASVSGIVQDKCMACHSRGYDLPFYAKVPGISAIIEKDYASGKLAEGVDADILMILTNDKMVDIDRDTEHPRFLEHITVEEAKEHIAADQFGVNSMLPKICASVDFITAGKGRSAIITNLENAIDALKGKTGTIITE